MRRSWDIFDTLIARRCIYPQMVFKIIERQAEAENFSQARIAAGKNIFNRKNNFNLDDIYLEFQRLTDLPPEICDALKNLEYEIELAQVIPIAENISQVQAGDILISDMYLPEEFIRRLLAKAGLIEPVEIVITSNGKSSGRIWQQLAAQKIPLFHVGDNEQSDLLNPRLFNLNSAITVSFAPNIVENFLMKHDFDFAAYLREIRLRNPFTEEVKRSYWEFFTLNVAILILVVQHIDALQKNFGYEYLGFCGRDTHYLRLLYEKFMYDTGQKPAPNDYLHYSRRLLKNSEADAVKYFQAKIKNRKALFIDLIGTGATLHKLRMNDAINFSLLICLVVDKNWIQFNRKPDELPENYICFADNPHVPAGAKDIFYFAGYESDTHYGSVEHEHFNRATHNSPITLNLAHVDEKILPLVEFNPISDTENFDVIEACLREVLNSKIPWPNLPQRGILEQLLKIFMIWAGSKIFSAKQTLETKADKFVDNLK